jgi:hypothetical protein
MAVRQHPNRRHISVRRATTESTAATIYGVIVSAAVMA